MKPKKWTGDKARPANRAKTWGRKDRDPRKERRNAKRDLRGSSRLHDSPPQPPPPHTHKQRKQEQQN